MHTQISHVEIPPAAAQGHPALWNPSAAVIWCLLFSPLFGACLHMLNWQALGQPAQAARARRWVWASVALLLVNGMAAAFDARMQVETPVVRWTTLGFMMVWYVCQARPQCNYLHARFGSAYARQRWHTVLLAAASAGLIYMAGVAVFTFVFISVT